MRHFFVALTTVFALVAAQETSTAGTGSVTTVQPASTTDYLPGANSTSASSTSRTPITHTIGVAKGGHTFEPDVTLAKEGDTIKFEFYPTNHSVVRAEYGYPCIPYEYTGVDKIGFFTGFRPVDAILDNPPSYNLLINDTNPIFFYCGAPGSCINWQMVGVINPNASTSLQQQKQLAKDSSFMLLPGQPWPSESEDPFTTTTTTSSTVPPTTTPTTATSTSATAAGATTTASEPSSSHHSGLSGGAIAGIAIGAAAVALAAAVLIYICGRQSQRRTAIPQHDDRPGTGHTNAQPMVYNPHGHIPGQYMDASKTMPMHSSTMPVSPALPGYVPRHDPTRSPPMHPSYAASDALSPGPGSDVASYHSASPTPMYAVPVYPSIPSPPPQPHQYQPFPYTATPPPAAHVHEMAGSDGANGHPPSAGMGFPGYINRRSSTSKSDGVERYG